MAESSLISGGGGLQLDAFGSRLPSVIRAAGGEAERRFVEFFVANIRNRNTRVAYAVAIWRFFEWCEVRDEELDEPSLGLCPSRSNHTRQPTAE